MSMTTEQIEGTIESTRQDLRSNLKELEKKAKAITDWREQFRNHPGVMLAGAAAVGALLGLVMVKRNRGAVDAYADAASTSAGATARQLRRSQYNGSRESWRGIKAALLGVATSQAARFCNEIIPGFRSEFANHQQNHDSHTPSSGAQRLVS